MWPESCYLHRCYRIQDCVWSWIAFHGKTSRRVVYNVSIHFQSSENRKFIFEPGAKSKCRLSINRTVFFRYYRGLIAGNSRYYSYLLWKLETRSVFDELLSLLYFQNLVGIGSTRCSGSYKWKVLIRKIFHFHNTLKSPYKALETWGTFLRFVHRMDQNSVVFMILQSFGEALVREMKKVSFHFG